MRRNEPDNRVMRVQFSSSNNSYGKIKMEKSSSTFVPKATVSPVDEDIYVDEVIFYDGGDVEGYGYGSQN